MAGPLRAELACEVLTLDVAFAGESVKRAALVPGDLRDDVGGCAEAIDAEHVGVACHAQCPIADETRAEQRRRLGIAVAIGECETESCVGDCELRVAAMDVIAGEAGVGAKIFVTGAAVRAYAAGMSQPGDAHSLPDAKGSHSGAGCCDLANDLVAGRHREDALGEVTVGHMQIGSADAAGANTDKHLIGVGIGDGEAGFDEGVFRCDDLHRRHGRRGS
jgi:hypothetical protein